MAKVIVSVISDLVTDQRVHKVSQSLYEMGFDVLVVGTKKKISLPLSSRTYKTKRISMLFQKGFLFYAEWNIRLFLFLLLHKATILLSNDLDTLLPNFILSKLKRKVLVYDTHEFFTETAELYRRTLIKKIWQLIENFIFPKLKYIYTVNSSIAGLYKAKYNKNLLVIRNVPAIKNSEKENSTCIEIKLPLNKRILLIQGSGLHQNRGLEELVSAITFLPDEFILVIAGDGLIIPELKTIVADYSLTQKIFFTGILPMEQLHNLTKKAFCGFSLDKPLNLNQQASLPNKLFDYIAANIPVIISNIKEVTAVVEQYNIGIVLAEVTPENIAGAVNKMATDIPLYNTFKQNTITAFETLNWDNEKIILETFFKKIAIENNITIG
jgi:glycosyltransferase involved in cell wall biosynthesis